MIKLSPQTNSVPVAIHPRIARLGAKLREWLRFEVPTGYQDENGFYYGEMRAPNAASNWSAARKYGVPPGGSRRETARPAAAGLTLFPIIDPT